MNRRQGDAEVPIQECPYRAAIHEHEIFSDGLQNAMKACENMDREAARFVDVRAHRAGAALVISIRNSYSGVLGIEDGMPRSHKQTAGHGIGLSSIRRAAEHTDTCAWSMTERCLRSA